MDNSKLFTKVMIFNCIVNKTLTPMRLPLLRPVFKLFPFKVPEKGLEHYMFNTPIGWISSLRFAPFLIQLNRASSPRVMCPTHHFSGTAFTSFNLCRREDLNLHALRHTHLKRTWLPITPLRQWLIV